MPPGGFSAPEDPLFPDSSNRAVLKYYVIKRLREALTRAGYDPTEFSGHSLRKGGAQSLFNCGLDMRDIACMGRWVIGSQSLRLYRELRTTRGTHGPRYARHLPRLALHSVLKNSGKWL